MCKETNNKPTPYNRHLLNRISCMGFLNGVKYEYWYQGNVSFNLKEKSVQNGTDYVFEKYEIYNKVDYKNYI